jgi:hypothetical protein
MSVEDVVTAVEFERHPGQASRAAVAHGVGLRVVGPRAVSLIGKARSSWVRAPVRSPNIQYTSPRSIRLELTSTPYVPIAPSVTVTIRSASGIAC